MGGPLEPEATLLPVVGVVVGRDGVAGLVGVGGLLTGAACFLGVRRTAWGASSSPLVSPPATFGLFRPRT